MKVGAALKTVFLFCALAMASEVYGYTAADYTNAGLKIYSQKNYTLAIRYFTAALAINPADVRSLQGRANCYYFLGQYQTALADYEKLLTLAPSGPISQFVQALRAKVGSTAPNAASPQPSPAAEETAVKKPNAGGFGLRVEPAYIALSLTDFNTDAQTNQVNAVQLMATDPTLQYNSSVPSACVAVGIEPIARLGAGFEIGFPFNILTIGKVSESAQDVNGYNQARAYDVSAFSVGLNVRYAFGSGVVRPFIGAGGLLAPIGINYTDIVNNASNATTSTSGSFSGMALGGQGQAGVDFHIGSTFVVSLFGGYQTATANSFKGNWTVSGSSNTQSYTGQLGMAQLGNGYQIVLLQDGATVPSGFRPLQVDLTGIVGGIHLAIFF